MLNNNSRIKAEIQKYGSLYRLHRNIDPAEKWPNGEKYWWFHRRNHRIGGSYHSHSKRWFIHGEEYSKKDYFNIVWEI